MMFGADHTGTQIWLLNVVVTEDRLVQINMMVTDSSASCLPETLPIPLSALSPLGSSNLTTLKFKQIRFHSNQVMQFCLIFVLFNYFFGFGCFFTFMNGHYSDYNGFFYICIVIFENISKPEIFHKYIVWFWSNSKKIHHDLLLNETQKDGPHPIWKQLQKAAHCQENMI